MGVCVVKLTARQRYILCLLFTAINFFQVFLGMILTGGSAFIVIVVSPKFYEEKAEITFVFTVTGMFGTHVMITYLIGVKIGDKCLNLAHKKSTGRHLIVWTIGSFNTTLNILVLSILAKSVSKHIVRALRHSLEKGMHSYLKDSEWKEVIDKWQFNMQCCGINQYDDWHKIAWLDKYHINLDNEVVKEFRASHDHLHLPVVPWSCCKTAFPMQCFHDPLQQINSKHIWEEQPNVVGDSISKDGCLNVLKQPIVTALSSIVIFCIILVVVQIILILLSRILYTSCKNAVILGDPEGIAPGWVFTKDCLSKNPGRTLSEMLIGMGVPRENIARYRVFTDEVPVIKHHPTSPATSSPKEPNAVSKAFSKISTKLSSSKSKTDNSRNTGPSTQPTSDADPISSEDEAALLLNK